jgi:hypothetical protein
MSSSTIGTLFTRIFIFLLGLLMTLAALNKIYIYCSHRFLGNTAYGVIEHPASSRDIGGRPLIQYKDTSGNLHEFKSKAKTHWFQTPKKGEKIRVFFDKNKPDKAIVDSFTYYLFLPIIFLAAGCYCCIYGIFQYKDMIRKEENSIRESAP